VPDFKLGDDVEWTSQSLGHEKKKRGVIAAVVPARKSPKGYIVKNYGGCVTRADGGGIMRNHESYLVFVTPLFGHAQPKLYWPVVSKLRRA
jgi:hypothetical protein